MTETVPEHLPEGWATIVNQNVSIHAALTLDRRSTLEVSAESFLAESSFVGTHGLDLDDEVRLTIAFEACVLLLGRPEFGFPNLREIRVAGGGARSETCTHDDGEAAVRKGIAALSWEEVLIGAADAGDGYNPVLHEFSHHLSACTACSDGFPLEADRVQQARWAEGFTATYEGQLEGGLHHRQLLFDESGIADPAELFAIATETFFEMPADLRDSHPDLYEQLRAFYGQDPVTYPGL